MGLKLPLPGAAVLLMAALAGCGGETDADRIIAGGANRPIVAEDQLVERRLVSEDDLQTRRDGTAERAFLEYWSAISYEDWSTAVRYVDARLRSVMRTPHLVSALAIEGQANLPVKPLIRSVVRTRGHVSIRYFTRTPQGALRPTSSAWERRGETWFMTYSATLDDSYASAVQQAEQSRLAPTATTPDDRAVRAGSEARRAQAQTLDPPRLSEGPPPSGDGG